jgi:peptide/nickel transport system permease protein
VQGVILFLAVGYVVSAPWIAPYDPIAADFGNVLSPPSWGHALGTDDIGRDILSRVVHGSRISLEAGLFTVALVVGLPLGLAAGCLGGRVDNLIMRGIEVILSFPTLVLALGITAILGPKSSGYLEQAPWLGAFPGLAIFLTVLGFNLLGDGLRDALDPRLKT